ncbi:protein of unknown function (4846) [Filimonas lacunae]|uniref:DUF4846 domain-containing protein n=1 Tax=Filimonas lacunae TaxID=477680 RepID=A0A173MCG0_9BACT|nr:DUF4846 domain-containing protein [Filimonas lacunae]BAV05264.1 hypothetical protein FLA_1271 [Filimonas lacunae]SIT22321.1 protein of unknown function (4846) [Filimonas lacunae]
MRYLFIPMLLIGSSAFMLIHHHTKQIAPPPKIIQQTKPLSTIHDIPLPEGFVRISQPEGSFGAYLRRLPLKADKTVYLYNGTKKANQTAQFAVLDIPVGNKDLQQCADAVMRIYAEYQYSRKQYHRIAFSSLDGTSMDFTSWMKGYRFYEKHNKLQKQLNATPCSTHTCLNNYLQTVFAYASTLSLNSDLVPVTEGWNSIQPGYVFIKGGSPGHAVLVTDVAWNPATGQKIFLLAQSYMPAQEIHILQNPGIHNSPWYLVETTNSKLYTPEWIFDIQQLKKFPA